MNIQQIIREKKNNEYFRERLIFIDSQMPTLIDEIEGIIALENTVDFNTITSFLEVKNPLNAKFKRWYSYAIKKLFCALKLGFPKNIEWDTIDIIKML